MAKKKMGKMAEGHMCEEEEDEVAEKGRGRKKRSERDKVMAMKPAKFKKAMKDLGAEDY